MPPTITHVIPFTGQQHVETGHYLAGVDPGFPIWGGGANPRWRGHQPLTQARFGENICKNERIWSCWGGGTCQKLLYVDPPLPGAY